MELNVNSHIIDPFYRYKMPAIITRVQGKDTVITNLDHIAKALSRPPNLIMHYFSVKIGCGKKKNKLMGTHDSQELQQLLQHFIDRYVICEMCKNPETYLSISHNQCIIVTCKACPA